MDEDVSMPDLEVWDSEEDILLLGDQGYFIGFVGFIDVVPFNIIARVPDNTNLVWLHHLQLPAVWWQERHVKTANDGHETANRAIRSYQVIQ